MKKIYILLIVFALSLQSSFSQGLNYSNWIWYFGFNAGLDFRFEPPTVLYDSQMNTFEGCSIACDGDGRLLFYTDGVTIWNKKHQVMANGRDLYGGNSSSTSAIIVPKPESETIFYIFTVSEKENIETTGLHYSVVDMTENGLRGAVIEKNVPVFSNCQEKLAVCFNNDKSCAWIVIKENVTGIYKAFKLTSTGLDHSSIDSQFDGIDYNTHFASTFHMRFSPNGDYFAASHLKAGIELMKFNKETGNLYDHFILLYADDQIEPKSVAFSPNSEVLYVQTIYYGANEIDKIEQYDLSVFDSISIVNSRYQIEFNYTYDIQLAPDGKIYILSKEGFMGEDISVINFPNRLGANCDFEEFVIDLDPNNAAQFPDFFSNFQLSPSLPPVPEPPEPKVYCIPDIGAPDMNVYMEMIGPYDPFNPDDSKGFFGEDGFKFEVNSNFFSFETEDPEDAWKIQFGPPTVSWDGRMVSTQVFVNPRLEPNSEKWNELSQEFRIPIRYKNGNNYGPVDTFYVVQPTKLGDIRSNPGRVFGEDFGVRSRRGAMIVDSLILANDVYTVSTLDCDPGTEGNQGYLPFVLLSKGKIQGDGIQTEISVSARDADFGVPGDGGPGGGGGGSRYVDNEGSEPGDDGGNGFTGGGPGGLNNFFGSNSKRDPGVGTGGFDDLSVGGYSLNGVPGGSSNEAHESAGGGTGHPFGYSGDGCEDGDNCMPQGRYGGGSGNSQNKRGGCGGYATDGTGPNSNPESGGNSHGNDMVVPIAGGSGGASGNPEITGIEFFPLFLSSAGNGGGGGGAIRVYSERVINLKLTADGGDGTKGWKKPTSSAREEYWSSHGGGGSGGHVGLFCKLAASNVIATVEGGNGAHDFSATGGAGRVRYDADFISPTTLPGEASVFQGFVSDTSKHVTRNHRLEGKRAIPNESIDVYMKSESDMFWSRVVSGGSSGNTWYRDLDLPKPDSIFFVCVVQNHSNPNSNLYEAEPEMLYSQAAANILRINKLPYIRYEFEDYIEGIAECMDDPSYYYIKYWNRGDADLEIYRDSHQFLGDNDGFELLYPAQDTTISPGDTSYIVIRRNRVPGMPFGSYNCEFLIDHNDSYHWSVPTIIFDIEYDILPYGYKYVTDDNWSDIDTLDLGMTCRDIELDTLFALYNTGEVEGNLKIGRFLISDEFRIAPEQDRRPIEINPPPLTYQLFFRADAMGEYIDYLVFDNYECSDFSDTLVVRAIVGESDLQFSGNFDFGTSQLGVPSQRIIRLTNEGNMPVYVISVDGIALPFTVVDINPTLPRLLRAGEFVDLVIEYTPTAVGNNTLNIYTVTDPDAESTCDSYSEQELSGNGVDEDIVILPNPLDFGTIPNCDYKDTLEVTLRNEGESAVVLISPAEITGTDAGNFRCLNDDIIDDSFDPGEEHIFLIEFDNVGGTEGPKNAQFIVRREGSSEFYSVDLTAEVEEFTYAITPDPFVFDPGVVNSTVSNTLRITNTSNFDAVISSVSSTDTDLTFTPNSNIPILAGGFVEINCEVFYRFEGSKSGSEIDIQFEIPCSESVSIDASGLGLGGDYNVPPQLFWGQVLDCEKPLLDLVVSNTGDAEIIIQKMGPIEGQDAALFAYQDTPVFPMPIAPKTSYSREIAFASSLGNFGYKEAFIAFEIESKGEIFYDTTQLRADVVEYDVASVNSLDFGARIIGTTNTLQFTLTNNNIFDIIIVKLEPFDYPSIYSISPDPEGKTIVAGASMVFDITFEPEDEISYPDEIKIDYTIKTCDGSKAIQLFGIGSTEPEYTLYLRIPTDLYATPTLEDYQIPIYGRIEGGPDFSGGQFTADLNMNYSLFYPNSFDKGTFTHLLDNGTRTISLDVDLGGLTLSSTEQVIASITGATLLGNSDKTDIVWDNFVWTSGQLITPQLVDGALEIEICREGGDRLVSQSSAFSLASDPNPADKSFNIVASSPEGGIHRLQLMNTQGRVVREFVWNNSKDNSNRFETMVDASGLASGMYFAVLKTPNRAKTITILLTK
jgi:hypothetical protein